MMEPVTSAPDLDVLFDLFSEDFADDMDTREITQSPSVESDNADDNTDDTSSESSGSSGHSSLSQSPPFQQISTYFPSPPSVAFAPNPLSSFTTETTGNSNKRSKTEDKLLRNRQSANKSRLKRKNEKAELEETVASLREQVRNLEMQNTALLTDNTTLTQHNFFLQGLLKKQQLENEAKSSSPVKTAPSSQNHMSALSGISMLCVVFSVSFFNEWLPSSLQSGGAGDEDNWATGSSSGRVLLSVDDDAPSHSSLLFAGPHHPSNPHVALHYLLILCSMCLYYFYIQYDNAVQKKSTRLLPS